MAGRASSPNRIGARNHSTASTRPARRKARRHLSAALDQNRLHADTGQRLDSGVQIDPAVPFGHLKHGRPCVSQTLV